MLVLVCFNLFLVCMKGGDQKEEEERRIRENYWSSVAANHQLSTPQADERREWVFSGSGTFGSNGQTHQGHINLDDSLRWQERDYEENDLGSTMVARQAVASNSSSSNDDVVKKPSQNNSNALASVAFDSVTKPSNGDVKSSPDPKDPNNGVVPVPSFKGNENQSTPEKKPISTAEVTLDGLHSPDKSANQGTGAEQKSQVSKNDRDEINRELNGLPKRSLDDIYEIPSANAEPVTRPFFSADETDGAYADDAPAKVQSANADDAKKREPDYESTKGHAAVQVTYEPFALNLTLNNFGKNFEKFVAFICFLQFLVNMLFSTSFVSENFAFFVFTGAAFTFFHFLLLFFRCCFSYFFDTIVPKSFYNENKEKFEGNLFQMFLVLSNWKYVLQLIFVQMIFALLAMFFVASWARR